MLPLSTPAFAEDEDALQSVSRIAPDVLSNTAPAHKTKVTDDELQIRTESADADIPFNSSEPVRIADSALEIKIGLPFSEQAVKGQRQSNEPVQFDNGNGTITIPVAKDDGSVQITTVIDNAQSPEAFQYDLDLPSGYSLQPNADGSVAFVDSSGKVSGGVKAPWAKDSRGAEVPTTYEVSGTTLTQIVAHKGNDEIAYPVVAEPWLGLPLIASVSLTTNPYYVVNVVPTSWGRNQAQVYTHFAHVDELRSILNSRGQGWALTYTIEQQFLCHVAGNTFEPGTYNMESWRPGVPWGTQLNLWDRCNPS